MGNIKSEIGTKAAWKGFSSQTSYIAYRLMIQKDNSLFYPEQVEDLLIKNNDVVQELVQVKNLSANLALSHLNPKDEDSFFRRCLKYKESSNIIIRLVSFGDIGEELIGLVNKTETHIKNISKKLLECGYCKADINWIFSHLEIEKYSEAKILNEIIKSFEKNILSMAAPNVIFDVLIHYISTLSRIGGSTSKDIWNEKLSNLALELTSTAGLSKQYGKTIYPLFAYKESINGDVENEYILGINARPQHIRMNLDIQRQEWIKRISDSFLEKKIVLIRGASGQGKSSLAYRYLLDNFMEKDILCIEKILSEENSIEIYSAISGIARNNSASKIIYIDVSPYDTTWLWICEQICNHNDDIKLIITIREEDFRRVSIDYNKIHFAEIELALNKEEAKALFEKYNSPHFLKFEDAWSIFGEKGPLMEFVYLLNQSVTLKSTLLAQINSIVINELNADEWLKFLAVICYAGKNNISINQTKIFSRIECPQKIKMLKLFQKEYFIKIVSNNHIDCLHSLRATLLTQIIKELNIFSEDELLLLALQSVDANVDMIVIEFAYENGISETLINSIGEIDYTSWNLYSGVLRAMLWYDVMRLYISNKFMIHQGDAIFNGNFIMFGVGDVTGYLDKDIDMSLLFKTASKQNPERGKLMREFADLFKNKKIDYIFVDQFISLTKNKLPPIDLYKVNELSSIGFAFLWLKKRTVSVSEIDCNKEIIITSENYDYYLDFMIGVQEQKWDNAYSVLEPLISSYLCKKFDIVYLNKNENELYVKYIYHVFKEGFDPNTRIMATIRPLRKLYHTKSKFNVEEIGYDLKEGLFLPDKSKHILNEDLVLPWITNLNSWLYRINEYDKLSDSWEDALNNIIDIRNIIIAGNKALVKGLLALYKTGNTNLIFSNEILQQITLAYNATHINKFRLPKDTANKYGIALNEQRISDFIVTDKKDEENLFVKHFNKYLSSLFNFYNLFIQNDNLIIQKIKNKKLTRNNNLSVINIVDSLESLSIMKKEFDNLTQEVNIKFDKSDDEEDVLEKLVNLWSYLHRNRFLKSKNIMSQRMSYMEKYIQKLDDLFRKELKSMIGVVLYEKNDTAIKLVIDNDFVIETLFKKFKEIFSNAKTLSFEGYLFKKYLSTIKIQYNLLGELLETDIIIDANSFIIYDEYDKFAAILTPTEQIIPKGKINVQFAAMRCFANLDSLVIVNRHCRHVIDNLDLLNTQNLNVEIFNSWVDVVSKKAIEIIFKQLKEDFQYVLTFIPKEISERFEDISLSFINLISPFIETPTQLVNLSYDEMECVVFELKSIIEKYFNYVEISY